MPKVELSRNHSLPLDEARTRVERMAREMEAKYGLAFHWKGERLVEFQRTGAKGHVKLEEGRVSVLVDLSLVLSALKGKVEQRLREGLEREFA